MRDLSPVQIAGAPRVTLLPTRVSSCSGVTLYSGQVPPSVARFDSTGCTKCHIPSLPSSLGPVDAYTDLLLHDMGDGLKDDIAFGDYPDSWREFRTQPLWGVSRSGPWLHDGRAATLDEAILAHGGESQAIRDAYAGLNPTEQAQIIAFLESL